MTSPYPQEWETSVVLNDGSIANVRPIRADDADLLDAFHRRQSQESVYFRFFRYRPELSDRELSYFTKIDYDARMAFVALVGDQLVAVARYESWDSPKHPDQRVGEVAFFTDDDHHGKGLATLLLEYLAAAARRNGMDRFTATVLPANYNMLRVFRSAGFEVSTRFEDGAIEVDLGIDVTEEATEAIQARGRRSQASSLRRILEPGSVAVIGASRTPGTVGHEVVRSLIDYGFVGDLQLVNHNCESGDTLLGLPVRASLSECDPFEVAVVAVPADQVTGLVKTCAELGANSLVVLSTGFSEAGAQGRNQQSELLDLVRHHGMRLIGPSSFGVINTRAEGPFNASYVPVGISQGSLGVLSQSGPLGTAVLDQLWALDVGVSTFVTLGNRADVSVNDVLQYWAEDEATQTIALYVESFGNLRNFASIAQSVAMDKPIIAVAPADDELADLLAQSGLILVDQVGELAKQCELAAEQPLPAGNRVAVLSNSSSVARLAAAACRKAGLRTVVPSSIAQSGAADAIVLGDLDGMRVSDNAAAETYEQMVVAAAVDDEVDLLLLAFVPTLQVSPSELARIFHQVNRAVDKPIAATGLLGPDRIDCPGLPIFTFPEEAARALGRMAAHSAWRDLGAGSPSRHSEDGHLSEVRASVSGLLGSRASREFGLSDPDMPDLLSTLSLAVAPFVTVTSAPAAAEAATKIGFPVVLKAGGLERRTAGETGGVALDLRSSEEVSATFDRMAQHFGENLLPAVVQSSVTSGAHLSIGLQQSAERGAQLILGIGGASAGSLPPQSRIALPTSMARLERLLQEDWLSEVVQGAAAQAALVDLLMSLAEVGDASPELAEVLCNPVLVREGKVTVVDVNVVLQPWPDSPLDEVRHL